MHVFSCHRFLFQAELEESARSSASATTPTPPAISTPSPPTPSSHDLLTAGVEDEMERGTTPVPSPSSPMERRRSVMETIYDENKVRGSYFLPHPSLSLFHSLSLSLSLLCPPLNILYGFSCRLRQDLPRICLSDSVYPHISSSL